MKVKVRKNEIGISERPNPKPERSESKESAIARKMASFTDKDDEWSISAFSSSK